MRFNYWDVACISNFVLFISSTYAAVVKLNLADFNSTIENYSFAFVNFYAEWCRFSQTLKKTFEEASESFKNDRTILFAKVDCDEERKLAEILSISKYPTLKYYFFGQPSKREYRMQRTVEMLVDFVKNKSSEVIRLFSSKEELKRYIDESKPQSTILLYARDKNALEMEHLRKIGALLRDDCRFYAGIGQEFNEETKFGNAIVFRPASSNVNDQLTQTGAVLQNFAYLKEWIVDKCVPIVREITFENAEELTEEGLPFVILFKMPDDMDTLTQYSKAIASDLMDHRDKANFLYADGVKFKHPLYHLGKSLADLPVIAIDSFKHMYNFARMTKLNETNVLRQFVLDLLSGKLHREFHYGPDVFESSTKELAERPTPPSSAFQNLTPSYQRYSFRRDEL